ncbi:acyltransferase [Pectobacterium carotovorum]|uniref:acyltransferase family protein n=1 Tax=Pectobacterium carotovorum TaxID=554 RepID=UPI003019D154
MKLWLTEKQSGLLDGFRGIAAVAVAVCHSLQIFIFHHYPSIHPYVAMVSQASVMIFFVLSGFLIHRSLGINRLKNGTVNLANYSVSRIQRIYPPLIFSFILVGILSLVSPYFFDSGTRYFMNTHYGIPSNYSLSLRGSDILSALTFSNSVYYNSIESNAPLWSLPLEIWYYVCAGLIFTLRKTGVILGIFLFFIISSVSGIFLYYSIVWGAGFLLSLMHSKNIVISNRLTITLIIISLCIWLFFTKILISNLESVNIIKYNISSGILFLFVLNLLINLDLGIRQGFRDLSSYSYTLYIIHFPILLFLFGCFELAVTKSVPVSISIGTLGFIFSIAISWKASHYVENKKFIKNLL